MSVHRKNTHSYFTDSDLATLDDTIEAFQVKFQATIAPLMPSKGNTIKWHKLSHLTTGIRRLGAPKHENAQFMEQRHSLVKAIYNGGCKRARGDADLKDVVKKTRIHDIVNVVDVRDLSDVRAVRKTVYVHTAQTGKPGLVKSGNIVRMRELAGDNTGDGTGSRYLKVLKAAQPEVSLLQGLLQEFASAKGIALTTLPQHIKVVKTGCIPGQVRSNKSKRIACFCMMTTVCNHSIMACHCCLLI